MSPAETVRENLVIGGGLAGGMVAMRLAAAGREVVLLEKERGAHHKVCGEFLSPEAVVYLRQAGVDGESLGGVRIDRLRFSARGKVVETRLPFGALSLSRRVLDAALLVRVARAGCEVRCGIAVQGLSRRGECWCAELSDGSVQCARNVFLATGKHDLRGWNRAAGKHGDLVGFKMHWRLDAPQTEALHGLMDLFLFEGGYGGLSLVEGGLANLCLVVRRARLRVLGGWQELLESLHRENALMAGRLADAKAVWERPLAVSSIPYGYICGEDHGVWPVGDQVGVIPSFTGDGMAIALHSGALAAEMFLAAKTPAEYQRAMNKHLRGSMRIATMLSRAMVSRAGSQLAPLVTPWLSRPARWIARRTRIPETVLRRPILNDMEGNLVELSGIEPLASSLRTRRSPS